MEFQQLQEDLAQSVWWLLDLVLVISIAATIVSLVAGLGLTYCLCNRETAVGQLGTKVGDPN